MKIKKLLLSVIAFVLPAIFMTNNVSAGANDSNITYQRIDNVYFYLTNNSTGAVDTNHVTKFFLNGKLAYCIEPMVDINTRVYNSGGWNNTNFTAELSHYVELVGYYGYEYPTHKTDKYWLASQKLIWEKANPNVNVRFTNGPNGTGGDVDLSRETSEILNLVNTYDTKPSFHNTTIEGTIGDEITVTDTNNVLSNYNLIYNGNNNVTKQGNSLKIKFDDKYMGTEQIRFDKTPYDNETTVIYYQGNNQKLASLRVSDPAVSMVNLKTIGGTVKLNKTGESLKYENASYSYEEIALKDTTFAVYTNEDIMDYNGNLKYPKYTLVGTLTSDINGNDVIENMYYGSYYLLEVDTDDLHILDNEKHYFNITKEDIKDGKIIKTFDFKNLMKKGTLEFTKTDLATSNPIPNTIIQIFTDQDRLIFTGKTDENGKITITDLPINQKMYIIEKDSATGYKITDEKVYFEIKDNGEIVKANMTNEKIKGTVEISKVDISTEQPLPNTLIEVYKKDTNELVYSGRTDENGKLIIKDLEYGKYYFLEKEAPEGYELNPEKMYFDIMEDGEIVKCTLKDKKEEVKEQPVKEIVVPNTSMPEINFNIVGSVIVLIIGAGLLIYVKRKK